jgi:hypothetical protein
LTPGLRQPQAERPRRPAPVDHIDDHGRQDGDNVTDDLDVDVVHRLPDPDHIADFADAPPVKQSLKARGATNISVIRERRARAKDRQTQKSTMVHSDNELLHTNRCPDLPQGPLFLADPAQVKPTPVAHCSAADRAPNTPAGRATRPGALRTA